METNSSGTLQLVHHKTRNYGRNGRALAQDTWTNSFWWQRHDASRRAKHANNGETLNRVKDEERLFEKARPFYVRATETELDLHLKCPTNVFVTSRPDYSAIIFT